MIVYLKSVNKTHKKLIPIHYQFHSKANCILAKIIETILPRMSYFTDMEHIERIQKTIDYIETNLKEQISLKMLSNIACYSEFHFHRLFHIFTGETVMDYIRKRRLTEAAREIRNSERKIIDIALDYRFNTPDSFTRAFKRFTGFNPGIFRKTQDADFEMMSKIALQSLFNLHSYKGLKMEPVIVTKEIFKVIGYELQTSNIDGRNFKQIPEFWKRYSQNNLYETIPGKKNPSVELGICCDFDPVSHKFSYVIGFETETITSAPANMVLKTVPSSKYAIFTTPKVNHTDFQLSIIETTKFIYSQWLPASAYEYNDSGYDIEIYDRRSSMKNNLQQMDICIPVK